MIDSLIIILFLSWVWFELNRLIEKDSWSERNFWGFLWFKNDWLRKYNLTSTKISNGLMTLMLLAILVFKPELPFYIEFLFAKGSTLYYLLQIVTYWFLWMWIRNIFLHIIFPKWFYLELVWDKYKHKHVRKFRWYIKIHFVNRFPFIHIEQINPNLRLQYLLPFGGLFKR